MIAVVGAVLGCRGSIPLAPGTSERLRSGGPILVLYRTTGAPWVDCPGDFGATTWKHDVELWESFQAQRTALLRELPVDPAGATAERFVALARARPGAPPFGSLRAGGPGARADPAPVLLLETTRWVLVGCFHEYTPWYEVRATLVAPGGEVLWRSTCGDAYPPDSAGSFSAEALEADGKALYARLLSERAAGCAQQLLAAFEPGAAAAAARPPGP